jgi:hypothetical protein
MWADCLGNVGSLTSHNPIGLHGLLTGIVLFFLIFPCISLFKFFLFLFFPLLEIQGERTDAGILTTSLKLPFRNSQPESTRVCRLNGSWPTKAVMAEWSEWASARGLWFLTWHKKVRCCFYGRSTFIAETIVISVLWEVRLWSRPFRLCPPKRL